MLLLKIADLHIHLLLDKYEVGFEDLVMFDPATPATT
jgi:hypothetical protein